MTLKNHHNARHIATTVLRSAPPTLHTALSDLGDLERWDQIAVEAFIERYMAVRDELAWKAARGLTLSQMERALLRAFDDILDGMEPASEPLSDEVLAIMNDVLRS